MPHIHPNAGPKIRSGHVGVDEPRAAQHRAAKISQAQRGKAQIRVFEQGAEEVGVAEIGPDEFGAPAAGSGKNGARDLGPDPFSESKVRFRIGPGLEGSKVKGADDLIL